MPSGLGQLKLFTGSLTNDRSANSGHLTVRRRASEKGRQELLAQVATKLRAEGLVKVALWQGVEVADDLWERII
jgi:RNA-binding protein YhbY